MAFAMYNKEVIAQNPIFLPKIPNLGQILGKIKNFETFVHIVGWHPNTLPNIVQIAPAV